MKSYIGAFLGIGLLALTGCSNNNNKDEEVVSKRFIHKYGYDVSPEAWEAEEYPGKVITTRRNGATIVANYEGGILHGPYTETYSHSQTLKVRKVFDKGVLIKQTFYDIRGIPEKEENFTSPTQVKVVAWFNKGTPKYVEEYSSAELLNGQYYTINNELESCVHNGNGIRTIRLQSGELQAKEVFENGKVTKKDSFHANGTPHEQITYHNGNLHGLRKKFALNGEPICEESYHEGKLHGTAIYYQNGYKYQEVPFYHGKKHGIERHYIDGHSVSAEVEWSNGKKHGSSILYYNGLSKTEFYYNNELVPRTKYEELLQREAEIATLQQRSENIKRFNFND